MKAPRHVVDPLKLASENRPARRIKSRVASNKAEASNTIFFGDSSGYNNLNSVDTCPVCGVSMTSSKIVTMGGSRQLSVKICLTHRICLPQEV